MGKSIEEQRKLIRAKTKSEKNTRNKDRVQRNRYYTDSMFVRGIYKLYFNNKVVYVGMSTTNVFSRISQHHLDKDKIFDSFSFFEYEGYSDKQLAEKEMLTIKKLQPKYNKTHNNENNNTITYRKEKPRKSRFKSEVKSLKYSETTDGKKIINNKSSRPNN